MVDSLVSECTASYPLFAMLIISSDNARGQISSLILIRQWYSARSIQCMMYLISMRSSHSWNLIDGEEYSGYLWRIDANRREYLSPSLSFLTCELFRLPGVVIRIKHSKVI